MSTQQGWRLPGPDSKPRSILVSYQRADSGRDPEEVEGMEGTIPALRGPTDFTTSA